MGPAGDQGSPSTAPGATRAGLETAGGVERLNLGALAAARETCDPSRVAEWDGGAESASSAWAGSPVVSDMRRGSLGDLVAASTGAGSRYERWRTAYPCALEAFEGRLAEQLRGKRIVLFTDYDGTLAPIVRDPELAFMSPSMRLILNLVSQLFPTAIVSGRARGKVEDFVDLEHLMYAGSHGLDIAAPTRGKSGERAATMLSHTPAQRFSPLMDSVFDALRGRVADIPGANVEHNKFAVSVHFRNCDAADFPTVMEEVQAELEMHSGLRMSRGRKVLEVRPDLEWDKGRALTFLMQLMELDRDPDAVPIYLGDDRTDEDAFRAVADLSPLGFGILVSSVVKPTAARYTLRDPSEVERFLRALAQWGMDAAFNPWLQKVGLVVSATRAAEVTAKTVDMVDHIPESEEIPPVPHDEASGEGPADEVVLWRPGRESYVMELAEAVKREEEAGSEVVRVEQCAAGGEEGGGGGQTFEGRSSGGRSHGQGRGGSRRSLARNSKGPVL